MEEIPIVQKFKILDRIDSVGSGILVSLVNLTNSSGLVDRIPKLN